MKTKRRTVHLWILILLYFSTMIITIVEEIHMSGNMENVFSWWKEARCNGRFYYIRRMLLYPVDYFTGLIIFWISLCYVKGRRKTYYICQIPVVLGLLISLEYDLPLCEKSFARWIPSWKGDALSYLYPMIYLIMLLWVLFFPFIYDTLLCRIGTIKMWFVVLLLLVVSTDIVSMLNGVVSWNIIAFFLKISILYIWYAKQDIIFRNDILIEDVAKNTKQQKVLVSPKLIIPMTLLLLLIFSHASFKQGGIMWMQSAQSDGYYYIGSMKGFIQSYSNPYQNKRHYLSCEYIGENTVDPATFVDPHLEDTKKCWDALWWKKTSNSNDLFEGYEWYYDTRQKMYIIETYGRKLEKFYYLDAIEYAEYADSRQHSVDYTRLEKMDDRKSYRAVLSQETYQNTIFYYHVSLEEDILPAEYYLSFGKEQVRQIERYDILIQGKEIPAYFIGMVHQFHVTKVEPYLHNWRENDFESRKNPLHVDMGRERTVRQY